MLVAVFVPQLLHHLLQLLLPLLRRLLPSVLCRRRQARLSLRTHWRTHRHYAPSLDHDSASVPTGAHTDTTLHPWTTTQPPYPLAHTRTLCSIPGPRLSLRTHWRTHGHYAPSLDHDSVSVPTGAHTDTMLHPWTTTQPPYPLAHTLRSISRPPFNHCSVSEWRCLIPDLIHQS